VGVAFRQFLSAGALSDPMSEGLAALACLGRRDIVGFIESMSGEAKAALAGELRRQLALMAERWPRLLPGWLPRTHERLTIPSGEGRWSCRGPSTSYSVPLERPGVGLHGQRALGRAAVLAPHGARFPRIARDAAQRRRPLPAGHLLLDDGELDVQDVSDQVLTEAVELTIDVVARLSAVEVVRAA